MQYVGGYSISNSNILLIIILTVVLHLHRASKTVLLISLQKRAGVYRYIYFYNEYLNGNVYY